MDCCLWLNRKKISNAAEMIDNFDLAAVRGYFLGGSLSEWLREHNGAIYADMLDRLSPGDTQLNEKLAAVFGKSVGVLAEVFRGDPMENCGKCGSFAGSAPAGSFAGSAGSAGFLAGSFGGTGSFLNYGSGGYSSFGSFLIAGSFNKFRLWEWEWEWRFGSFAGSFRNSSWRGGSFAGGSFLGGSFGFGSFSGWLGSFAGSFGWGSFAFPMANGSCFITADEYDRLEKELA